MINKKINLILLTIPLILFSCRKSAECGGMSQREIDVSDFTEITLISEYSVNIRQSDETYVRATGCMNDLDELIITESNGRFTLKRGRKRSSGNIRLEIGMKELSYLRTDGVVDVIVTGFETDIDRKIVSAGTGEITFTGLSDDLLLDISGTSTVNLNGSSSSMKIEQSGVSELNAYDSPSEDIEIDISGTSDAYLKATKSLIGHASGTSNVYFKGVQTHNVETSGTAKVRNRN